jgi:hypothetical protein
MAFKCSEIRKSIGLGIQGVSNSGMSLERSEIGDAMRVDPL